MHQPDFISKCERIRTDVLFDPVVQQALDFVYYAQRNNDIARHVKPHAGAMNAYSLFFKAAVKPDVSYLTACVIHIEFNEIRKHALKSMQSAYYYSSRNAFAVQELAGILALELHHLHDLLVYYGIPFEGDAVFIGKIKTNGKMANGNFVGLCLLTHRVSREASFLSLC